MGKRLSWIQHLFWLLGMTYRAFFEGDIDTAVENLQFTKLHVTSQWQLEEKADGTIKQVIDQALTTAPGIILSAAILLSVITLFAWLLNDG
jgi:hypothetical protein